MLTPPSSRLRDSDATTASSTASKSSSGVGGGDGGDGEDDSVAADVRHSEQPTHAPLSQAHLIFQVLELVAQTGLHNAAGESPSTVILAFMLA